MTDGEFRRTNFQDSFASAVSGLSLGGNVPFRPDAPPEKARPGTKSEDPTLGSPQRAESRLRLVRNRPLEEFRFAQSVANVPAKVTILGPARIMQRYDAASSRDVYRDVDEFLEDLIAVQRQMVQEVVAAGCKYVQIDAPAYTAYVDPTWQAALRARGDDPDESMERAIRADNAVIAGFSGVTFGIHICRGNRQSTYHREGPYDPIAERLFAGLHHQRLLLEYDSDRAGGFEPLRFVPPDKVAVLGLVSTKFPSLEAADAVIRRIDDASRFLPVDRLAVSPQCGFASSFPGNKLSEEDQWRKLKRVREVATRVWS